MHNSVTGTLRVEEKHHKFCYNKNQISSFPAPLNSLLTQSNLIWSCEYQTIGCSALPIIIAVIVKK